MTPRERERLRSRLAWLAAALSDDELRVEVEAMETRHPVAAGLATALTTAPSGNDGEEETLP